MYNILTDTCFWIALFDENGEYHLSSLKIFEYIRKFNILIPWPVFYEVLRSKFVKKSNWVERFKESLISLKIYRIDDSPYRELALKETIKSSISVKRAISLVDMVIRFIMLDRKHRIDYLITYNEKDFYDVCVASKTGIFYP